MRAFERRVERDIHALEDYAAQSNGRLKILLSNHQHLRLCLTCRSVTCPWEGADPEIREYDHIIEILIPPTYPAQSVLIKITDPAVFHPNVAPLTGSRQSPLGILMRGQVCYSHHHSPTMDLIVVLRTIYDILGYRASKWSKSLTDCLNPQAVRWANALADSGVFPLERRPLIGS
jgi:hypothetical protein